MFARICDRRVRDGRGELEHGFREVFYGRDACTATCQDDARWEKPASPDLFQMRVDKFENIVEARFDDLVEFLFWIGAGGTAHLYFFCFFEWYLETEGDVVCDVGRADWEDLK